jgi:Flp pilus assembly pilin Flp
LFKDQPREQLWVGLCKSIIPLFAERGGKGQWQERKEREPVARLLKQFWKDERGQDIAEYAVMLAVILVIVVGTIRLIGSNANNVFSQVGSAIQ